MDACCPPGDAVTVYRVTGSPWSTNVGFHDTYPVESVAKARMWLGGSGAEDAALAAITGPGFGPEGIVDAVEKVVDTYLELRAGPEEPFLAAYGRLGPAPFKEALYAAA